MPRLIRTVSVLSLLTLCLSAPVWLASQATPPAATAAARPAAQQAPAPQRLQYPPVFFREDWKLASGLPNTNSAQEPEHPLGQGDVANPNLELRLYGDKSGPVIVQQPNNDDITFIMTLLCKSNCAIALRDKNSDVDLTGLATIRWRTKISGFHLLHPILKLADGTWIVGDTSAGFSTDWVESEIQLADVRWRNLNIDDVVEARDGKWLEHPNLSRVEEIGFTDLMRGAGHGNGGGSRVDWIEVHGKPVPRLASSSSSSNR